jgi:hypothetical protein
MTARRCPLLIAGLALILPACLHLEQTPYSSSSDQTSRNTPPATSDANRKIQFAELPSRPGAVVSVKPSDKDVAASRPNDVPMGYLPPAPDEVVPAAKTSPATVPDSPLLAAVRAHEEGKPDRAIELLAVLERPNQELVLAMLPVLTRGATIDLRDPAATAILTDQIRTAATRIEAGAALKLDVVTLCDKVRGYGMYDPRPKGLPYGTNDSAQIYLEVRNLVSQPAVGPHGENYLTHYRTIAEVRDSYGRLMDQWNPDTRRTVPVVQLERKRFTRTPIHDFHILYQFLTPPAPGVYNVSLTIEDPVTQRSVKTEPIEFRVAGP